MVSKKQAPIEGSQEWMRQEFNLARRRFRAVPGAPANLWRAYLKTGASGREILEYGGVPSNFCSYSIAEDFTNRVRLGRLAFTNHAELNSAASHEMTHAIQLSKDASGHAHFLNFNSFYVLSPRHFLWQAELIELVAYARQGLVDTHLLANAGNNDEIGFFTATKVAALTSFLRHPDPDSSDALQYAMKKRADMGSLYGINFKKASPKRMITNTARVADICKTIGLSKSKIKILLQADEAHVARAMAAFAEYTMNLKILVGPQKGMTIREKYMDDSLVAFEHGARLRIIKDIPFKPVAIEPANVKRLGSGPGPNIFLDENRRVRAAYREPPVLPPAVEEQIKVWMEDMGYADESGLLTLRQELADISSTEAQYMQACRGNNTRFAPPAIALI